MQSRKWQTETKKNRIIRFCMKTLLFFFIVVIICDLLFGKAIRRTMTMQTEILAARIVSQCINEELTNENINYQSICQVQYDKSGNIRNVHYDTSVLNRLLAQLENTITERLSGEESTVSLPLGTLLGIELLSARGPSIPLSIRALGMARLTYHSDFSSAGINQTRHRIMATLEVKLNTYIPFWSEDLVFEKEICLAEMILVGEVPDRIVGNETLGA